ncbi:MAG: ABC transporter ATP-binding protein/permease [Firmicutes bacterium]|nr:ABC transporter ATP-binding protein/permease [Bacillota bacterium]
MLKLENIVKVYGEGENAVEALKGVSLNFRQNEFVAILGASGCGKTTMLNIIGGLDKYTSGDLIISERSTKYFKDKDWDAYRNHYIGFVFQSYNLIPHLTVLGNVEISLTLSGISPSERKRRAKAALEEVGLSDKLNKRPNQLSGGQMQRVAIARAIVNNPEIIMADEPTGALDSTTSVAVMDLLKEIAKTRLVIMVTHNREIADEYATRIVEMKDGVLIGDSSPFEGDVANEDVHIVGDAALGVPQAESIYNEMSLAGDEEENFQPPTIKHQPPTAKPKKPKTSMSFFTALKLSGKNLLTKKGRTFLTSFAGSIGIIGIALILALSNGFTGFIQRFQAEMLSYVPIQITASSLDLAALLEGGDDDQDVAGEGWIEFPDDDTVTIWMRPPLQGFDQFMRQNRITQEYIDHLRAFNQSRILDMVFNHNIQHNIVTRQSDNSVQREPLASRRFQPFLDHSEFMWGANMQGGQYTLLAGNFPTNYNEVVLVVDRYNRIDRNIINDLGLNFPTTTPRLEDFLLDDFFTIIANDNFYIPQPAFQRVYERRYVFDEDENDYVYRDVLVEQVPIGNRFVHRSDSALTEQFSLNAPEDIRLSIVGVIRVNPNAPSTLLRPGIAFSQELTERIIEINYNSDVSLAQREQLARGTEGIFDVRSPFPIHGGVENQRVVQTMTRRVHGNLNAEVRGFADIMGGMIYGIVSATTAGGGGVLPPALVTQMLIGFGIPEVLHDVEDGIDFVGAFINMTSEEFDMFFELAQNAFIYQNLPPELEILSPILTEIIEEIGDDLPIEMLLSLLPDVRNLMVSVFHAQRLVSLNNIAASRVPNGISIFPLDFEGKEYLTAHLDDWNDRVVFEVFGEYGELYRIVYQDLLAIVGDSVATMVNIISIVLVALAAVSLVVSSVMIAIIMYVSVIERTKEIGVLRSVGARKKDIRRVFIAEAGIIGAIAGTMGVFVAFLLTFVVNPIIRVVTVSQGAGDLGRLAIVNPWHALLLIGVSIGVTIIAGFIPSLIAAKKDPVVALRTE